MLGRWIDRLPQDAKDRIVRGQGWTAGYFNDGSGRRCLVGHASNWRYEDGALRCEFLFYGDWASDRFDRLVDRFGLDRIVRACKLRAGADMSDLADGRIRVEVSTG